MEQVLFCRGVCGGLWNRVSFLVRGASLDMAVCTAICICCIHYMYIDVYIYVHIYICVCMYMYVYCLMRMFA